MAERFKRGRFKKRLARDVSSERKRLVHAAGCTDPRCASKGLAREFCLNATSGVPRPGASFVRVPRTLRHLLRKQRIAEIKRGNT